MVQTNPLTADEIQQLRAETKGTAQTIHFNNAGASLPPDVVVDTVITYLQEEAVFGGYETEYKYKTQLQDTYHQIARLINADADEIAIIENASIAWGTAFNGIDFKAGDEIIISEMEYVTNLIGFLNVQKNNGVSIKVIPNDAQGDFSLADFEAAISPKTKLIAITHIPSTSGNIVPVAEIGKIAGRYGILYLVDACQSAGQMPVDVKEIGCDMLSVTGRKYLRAPRGTGFLFVKKAVQDKLKLLFMDGSTAEWVTETDFKIRQDARRFEVYEKNRAPILGLGKAVEYALEIGIDRIWQRIQYLAGLMRRQLEALNGVIVHDAGSQTCGIITFSVKGFSAETIKKALAAHQINVSVGKAISTLIYMNKNQLSDVARASVHYYNTEKEIAAACSALLSIISQS